ncbi:MAG: hypothetical protein IKR04_01935 [Clostridia bacterium]|nr:hypothetical protein [Clostridia bacterium]
MEDEVVTQTINVGEVILDTINSLCNSLFSSIDDSILPELDNLVFLNADATRTTYMQRIVGENFENGLLTIAFCLVIAFVLYYAIKRFTAFYSGASIENPYQFLVKAVVVTILSMFSLSICTSILGFTYEITEFILDLGKKIFGFDVSFSNLILALSKTTSGDFNLFSFDGILRGMLSISSFTLIITFAFRYILTKVLILLSPFAILCLMNKSTYGIFRGWLKSFASLLLIQIIIALILLLPFAILKENPDSIFNKFLLIGSVYALLKSNQFVKEFINGTGISTDFSSGFAGIRSLIGR